MSETGTAEQGHTDSGRKSKKPRLFEFRGQWLTKETKAGRDYWFRNWYEASAGRAKRRALGARNLADARQALTEAVLAAPPTAPDDPQNVYLAAVLQHYLDAKQTAGMRSICAARRACALVLDYLRQNGKEAPKVADFDLVWQTGFQDWCRDTHQLSAKSIASYCLYIKAALRMAAIPRIVNDSGGGQRVVKTLKETPFVEADENKIATRMRMTKSKPRDFVPTFEQMGAFADAIEEEHVFRFFIMALNTWARPEAICQINVAKQVDFENGILDINPPGRPQTNKIRPVIKLTDCLKNWFTFWNLDCPIIYQGKPCAGVNYRSIKKVARRAGIAEWDRFFPYTFRHFMATKIRAVPNCPVSREERAEWLGHIDQKHRTTQEWYETFDPDYLEAPARATEAILRMIDAHSRRRLFAPVVKSKAAIYLAANG